MHSVKKNFLSSSSSRLPSWKIRREVTVVHTQSKEHIQFSDTVKDKSVHTASARLGAIWSFADVDITMEINLSKQNATQFWLKIEKSNNIIFEKFTDQFVRRLGLDEREELHHKALMKRGNLQLHTGGNWQQHCPVAVTLKGTTGIKRTFAQTIFCF